MAYDPGQLNVGSVATGLGNLWAAKQQSDTAVAQAAALAKAAGLDFDTYTDRADQMGTAAQEKLGQRTVDAMKEMGRINAILADSNLTGNTAQALRREITQDASFDNAQTTLNAKNQLAQTQREIAATSAQYQSKLNSIAKPNALQTTLNTAAGLINGYSKGGTFNTLWEGLSKTSTTKTKPFDPSTSSGAGDY